MNYFQRVLKSALYPRIMSLVWCTPLLGCVISTFNQIPNHLLRLTKGFKLFATNFGTWIISLILEKCFSIDFLVIVFQCMNRFQLKFLNIHELLWLSSVLLKDSVYPGKLFILFWTCGKPLWNEIKGKIQDLLVCMSRIINILWQT